MGVIRRTLSEFKDFAAKGDAITLAIGVIIGAAFKGIIDSLVNDIIMPPISFLTTKIDFSNLFWVLGRGSYSTYDQAKDAGAIVIRYGNFLNQVLIFLITAFVIFITINKLQRMVVKKEEEENSKKLKNTKACKYCLMEIPYKATKCGHCTSTIK
ncbi:large conductance mechanosensitive channel protein MscL [Candidatus Dojkabacteria bacterium]|nr:large conductance mechanosensitive channel protein MscL [Candidatus Dojkabacteria bacterium]